MYEINRIPTEEPLLHIPLMSEDTLKVMRIQPLNPTANTV